MEIFLLVLKVIGIILLSILGLILFLVLLVLLTPFRYHLKGKYHDNKPDVLFNLHFWFHLISAKAIYNEQGLVVKLRIFFITKYIISPDKNKGKKPDIKQTDDKPDDNKNEIDEMDSTVKSETENIVDDNTDTNVEDIPSAEDTSNEADEENKTGNSETASEADVNSENDDGNKTEVSNAEKSITDKIADKIKGVIDKATELKEKFERKKNAIVWLLERPETLRLLIKVKNQGIKILKSILPRKFKGYFTLGLEDPKTMGMICMYASILYPYGAKNFEFTPVFDEKIIDGDGEIKGRIILGALLLHALKIVFCRDFFRTLKNIKKFKKLWR